MFKHPRIVLTVAALVAIALTAGPLTAQQPANVISKGGIVTGVNKPGDGTFDTFTVQNGNQVTYAKYAPVTDDVAVKIAGGLTYNMFMITQPDNNDAQAFIVWSPDDPTWQDKLSKTDTEVSGIGDPGPNTLKRGDSVQISVQSAEGGGTDVTLDVWRDNKAVATFSFVVRD